MRRLTQALSRIGQRAANQVLHLKTISLGVKTLWSTGQMLQLPRTAGARPVVDLDCHTPGVDTRLHQIEREIRTGLRE